MDSSVLTHREASPNKKEVSGKEAIRKDILASFVVFLVAVPLSLGIALASGAPIVSGLIAGIIGGIIVGALGGAPLQVSGPAAGLSVMVFGFVQQFGWAEMCLITLMAGGLQMLLGFLRVARVCLAITPAVVHGMLAGIGILIALAQLHIILGGSPQESGLRNLEELPGQISRIHGPAALVGLLTIGLLLLWESVPKKLKALPGALVSVLLVTFVSVIFSMDVKRVDLPENLFSSITFPHLPPGDHWLSLLGAALAIAMVASIESLLSAVASDKLHIGGRANLDREMLGQGAGNLVSGFLGGLPVTGVIVRTSANIQAGAQTRRSSILHGVWILLATSLLAFAIEKIPLAALAGLLVVVGLRLVNLTHIRELRQHKEAWIYAATVAGVVLINLLAGVAIGIGLAVSSLLWRLATTRIRVVERDGRWHARIDGALTFLSVPNLTKSLAAIPAGQAVDVDLEVDFMDHAAFDALHSWRVMYEKSGGRVDIDERHERWYDQSLASSETSEEETRETGIRKILRGTARFNRGAGRRERDVLARLARDGQEPPALLLTCVDSRIDTGSMTRTGPGELLVVRNVGNVVPPYEAVTESSADNALAATLEFAVEILGIRHIIVCGHAECGAMKMALSHASHPDCPSLGAWLENATSSVARSQLQLAPDEALNAHNHLAQANVLQQLDNLAAYPSVRDRLDRGEIVLHGWYFDIADAQVQVYHPTRRRFLRLEGDFIPELAAR